MRNSARKNEQNRSVKSRLKTLETRYRSLLAEGKKDDAIKVLPLVQSAFDKAAKTGVVHKATASRKTARLAAALKRAK